jgi:protoporphyrinogen oxidase
VNQTPVLILGAGPTGLSAAYHLGADAMLVERGSCPGGWCRSVEVGGFTFDLAEHGALDHDPAVHDLYRTVLGDEHSWQNGSSWRAYQALTDGLVRSLETPLQLENGLRRIAPSLHTAALNDGSLIEYQSLISTIPLRELILRMGAEAPEEIHEAVAGLRRVSMRSVHLGIGRTGFPSRHWIDYPEGTVFSRIYLQGNVSAHCSPEGSFGLTCEIPYTDELPLPCEGDELIARCVADGEKVGILRPGDPIRVAFQSDLPYAFVVLDRSGKERIRRIRAGLLARDIVLAGRSNDWGHFDADTAVLAGRRAAQTARARRLHTRPDPQSPPNTAVED